MIVMDPDKIARLVDFCDFACKGSVGRLVVGIVSVGRGVFCSDVLPKEIVEERPQCLE